MRYGLCNRLGVVHELRAMPQELHSDTTRERSVQKWASPPGIKCLQHGREAKEIQEKNFCLHQVFFTVMFRYERKKKLKRVLP